MTTLISAHNSDGCIGRCDARCHDATGSVCTCICGGRNHGVGHKQAQANTREHVEQMIQEYQELHQGKQLEIKLNEIGIRQLALF